jgi:hypothetical protein
MKKFSKITGQIISKPILGSEKDKSETEYLKREMLDLMDKYLRIQSYGSVDNRFLSGSVKINGKEMLAEALLDIISNKSKKDQVSILESLKSKNKDWQSIDNEIKSIKDKNKSYLSNKFSKVIERYKDDVNTLKMVLEKKLSNVNDFNIIENYKTKIKDSEFLSKEDKSLILESSIFSN